MIFEPIETIKGYEMHRIMVGWSTKLHYRNSYNNNLWIQFTQGCDLEIIVITIYYHYGQRVLL